MAVVGVLFPQHLTPLVRHVQSRCHADLCPPARRGSQQELTHTGDPLGDQVFEESVDDRVVSGVQLVSINPNVEAQPVGVGVGRELSGRAELIDGALGVPA